MCFILHSGLRRGKPTLLAMETNQMNLRLPVWYLLLLVFAMHTTCTAHKILLVTPPQKSHIFAVVALGREMLRRGHDVHILLRGEIDISPKLLKTISQNESNSTEKTITSIRYSTVSMSGEVTVDAEAITATLIAKALELKGDFSGLVQMMKDVFRKECRMLLNDNEAVMERLTIEKYDFAVVDNIFAFRCLYLVPHRLGIPWVAYTDFGEPWLIRVPWPTSFVTLPYFQFTERMNFIQRFKNTMMTLMFAWQSFPVDEDVIAKYHQYGDFDSIDTLPSRSLLWITSYETVLDYPKPSMPNVVDAAGLSIDTSSTGDLPSDIASFIEDANRGVILVTFGSMASSFPVAIVEKFFAAFCQFQEYRIIWRLHNNDNVKVPANVKLARWLPQNDLLAHPRTKLFITHCGNGGQVEAIYYGVPMIGFPLLGDQHYNGKRIQYHGYGIAMNIHDFTVDQLVSNIRTVLEDPSYSTRVKKASMIVKSSPMKPAERAAYWIEHVMKFGGDHLRSSGNDLPLYQYFMLDILAFMLVVVVTAAACAWKILMLIVRKVCRKNRSSVVKTKRA